MQSFKSAEGIRTLIQKQSIPECMLKGLLHPVHHCHLISELSMRVKAGFSEEHYFPPIFSERSQAYVISLRED